MDEKADNKIEPRQKDDLTGFFLKKEFFSFLNELIGQCAQTQKTFSIIVLDIDHFKKFNDKFGHLFGDKMLEYMASILRLSFHDKTSECFRYGGDEFIIVLPDKNSNEAMKAASQFKSNMSRRHFVYNNRFLKITTSSGIANFPFDGQTAEGLVKKADEAMYFSKRHGRNTTTIASRIGSLKLMGGLLIAFVIFIALVNLFLWKDFVFKRAIPTTLDVFKVIKTALPPINCDRVVLNSGAVYNGEITEETNTSLVISVDAGKDMTMTLNLDKTNIAKVQYGLRTPSRQRYVDYMKDHPNPHLD